MVDESTVKDVRGEKKGLAEVQHFCLRWRPCFSTASSSTSSSTCLPEAVSSNHIDIRFDSVVGNLFCSVSEHIHTSFNTFNFAELYVYEMLNKLSSSRGSRLDGALVGRPLRQGGLALRDRDRG